MHFCTHEEGLVDCQDTAFKENEDSKKGKPAAKARKHCFKKTWFFIWNIFERQVPRLLVSIFDFFLPLLF